MAAGRRDEGSSVPHSASRGFARRQLCSFAWDAMKRGCTCSRQFLAELVLFQLQEAVLGRSNSDEPLTFYNLIERKEQGLQKKFVSKAEANPLN